MTSVTRVRAPAPRGTLARAATGLGLVSQPVIEDALNVGYFEFGIFLIVVWWLGLRLFNTRDRNLLGSSDEYQRITHATVIVFGVIAIASLLLKLNLSRGYLGVASPLA